ncbi:MAG TPA: hypothetical protein VKR58_11895 [Aquella sp.]|nr:hypothetical protein [Aquella sp.]
MNKEDIGYEKFNGIEEKLLNDLKEKIHAVFVDFLNKNRNNFSMVNGIGDFSIALNILCNYLGDIMHDSCATKEKREDCIKQFCKGLELIVSLDENNNEGMN